MTTREKCIELQKEDLSQKEIGEKLNICKATVSWHIGKRMTKEQIVANKTDIRKVCVCGKYKDKRTLVCKDCNNLKMREKWDTLTIGEKVYDKHKYAKYSYVRYIARTLALEAGVKCCQSCGYDKHYEICHIKAISEFTSDTLIKDINSLNNLIALCPNCHWEFDNNQLSLTNINVKSRA